MRSQEAPVQLNFLAWGGYESPNLLVPFARRHQVAFHVETILSDAVAADRLISDRRRTWDLVNINSPYTREVLHPRGLIQPLSARASSYAFEGLLPQFSPLYRGAFSPDGRNALGVCQRFGPLNLVVDSRWISPKTAEDQGFQLANDPQNTGRFGILTFDDFNVFHICIGAGLNPFARMDEKGIELFEATARAWHNAASLVTNDFNLLNDALLNGGIHFYISGGTYTIAALRRAGHDNIHAVTPRRGPINGKGGIVFIEVTSAVTASAYPDLAEAFLEYLASPSAAITLGAARTCIPVAQMGNPKVMRAFGREQLMAMQWESLEADIARCAEYEIPPDYQTLHGRLIAARGTSGIYAGPSLLLR